MRPYVRAANIGWMGWQLDDVKSMNFTDVEMDTYRLEPGDILLGEASGSAAEVGKPAIWNGEIPDCAFQNTLIRVRPRCVDSRYLLHYFAFCAGAGHFARKSRGVGIFHLGRTALAEWEIPLPLMETQRRIAALLDAADALRAKRRQAIARLEVLSQAIFIDMFGDPATNPKRWLPGTVAHALEFLKYGPRFYEEPYAEKGVPVVRITDLDRDGRLDFSAMPRYDVSEEVRRKHRLKPGDIIFARSGATVGKTALMREEDPECIAGAYFVHMRFKSEIDPEYACAALRMPSIQRIVAAKSRQAAQQNFSGPGIKKLPLPVPPLDLQQEFAASIREVERHKRRLLQSEAGLDALFTSLQQRAFRGEL
jgi:type I restriction enzyme S subunit